MCSHVAVSERDAALRDKQEGTCRMEAALALANRDKDQALGDTARADAEIRERSEEIGRKDAEIAQRRTAWR